MKCSALDLVLAGCDYGKRVLMIDMDGSEIAIDLLNECIRTGLQAVSQIIHAITELRTLSGRSKRQAFCGEQLYGILMDARHDKLSRDRAISEIDEQVLEHFKEKVSPNKLRHIFNNLLKKSLRKVLFKNNVRCDGRKFDEFRPVAIKVDVHRNLHGSALFQRGQTQVVFSCLI
ncbi:unnamed protein product [Gongylonema pulchrum]|uniref:PNPase domain-containing protein n=1 Tax=Gongylonema pulchrum TaxID=637853 RepID=A0A183DCS7_9BILA|nr:unnamed protein product [Gongylonema pulchrum]